MMREYKARSIHKTGWKICLLAKQANSQKYDPEHARCELMFSEICL